MTSSSTAESHPNIALIKYWGNRNAALRLPVNGSISISLANLWVRTEVEFDAAFERDQLTIDDENVHDERLSRVTAQLDVIRQLAGSRMAATVRSKSNFPPGVGIASSAAGFAALSLAATEALDLSLDRKTLSRLARRGSGSASRSVFGGYVEWHMGTDDESSFAEQIYPPDYWQLSDVIAVVSKEHKTVGSTAGHALADTSPLQALRAEGVPDRLAKCKSAIEKRDFSLPLEQRVDPTKWVLLPTWADWCNGCGACVEECPKDAITIQLGDQTIAP